MHDWPDLYAEKILVHLRKAATPDTKLILMDSIMSYACHDPSGEEEDAAPGSAAREAPAPLLANYGAANEMGYTADFTVNFLCESHWTCLICLLQMLLVFNAQERTLLHLGKLLKKTGWKISKVGRDGVDGFLLPVAAVPV